MPANTEDPVAQILQLGTELNMAEHDLKKAQRDMEIICKLLNLSEDEARMDKENRKKYIEDFQRVEEDIKRLNEKIKGNMYLIQAMEVLWDEIIQVIKYIWEFLVIVSDEKTIVRDMESLVMKNKQKLLERSKFAKIMIDFINSKSDAELKEHDLLEKTLCAMDLNKMIIKNIYRKNIEKKMNEIKEVVSRFNILFDKRVRAGLPSCQDLQGNLLPWKSYETFLVEAKSNIDITNEKTTVLKGETIMKYLNKDFKLLWMVKTLFTENPTYSRITMFRMELNKLEEVAKSNV